MLVQAVWDGFGEGDYKIGTIQPIRGRDSTDLGLIEQVHSKAMCIQPIMPCIQRNRVQLCESRRARLGECGE